MSEIINFNKKRKAKARAQKEVRAAENRLKHGRTKQEKQLQQLKASKLEQYLQARRLEKKDDE